jgi:amino acid permease
MGSGMKKENIEVSHFDPKTAEQDADHGVLAHQVGWETHRGLKSRHVQLLALGMRILLNAVDGV